MRDAVRMACLATALVAASPARASGICSSLPIRGELTCSSVLHDEITPQTPNRLSGPYRCPGSGLHQAGGEHVYSFTCQKDGPVTLLVDQLSCDIDIYVLGSTCDPRSDCQGASVAASNASDAVRFACEAGKTYYVVLEGYGFQSYGACSAQNPGTYRLRFDVSDATGGCAEWCGDGQDNDHDGLLDCDDPDCAGEEICVPPQADLGFDLSGLPSTCVAGRSCDGVVEVTLPERDSDRVRSLETLDEPSTQILLDDGLSMAELDASGDRTFSVSRTYGAPGSRSWQLVVRDGDGEVVAEAAHELEVIEPLVLVTPATLDFGTIRAGTPTLADNHCVQLDLAGSRRVEDHLFDIAFAQPEDGCLATPVLWTEDRGRPRALSLPLSGLALTGEERFCLEVPECAGEVAPEGTALELTPVSPLFQDQQASVALRWRVTERSWLACNWWWVVAILGGLALVWVVYGFVRPARFPRHAVIQVAGSEKGLRRGVPVVLVECRGSSAGFYRSARLGVRASGDISGRVRGAAFRIRADRILGLVIDRGPIERLNRRTRKWETPEDLAGGHVPDSSAVYRCGQTWFRIEL